MKKRRAARRKQAMRWSMFRASLTADQRTAERLRALAGIAEPIRSTLGQEDPLRGRQVRDP
jgi:hypothetical protein